MTPHSEYYPIVQPLLSPLSSPVLSLAQAGPLCPAQSVHSTSSRFPAFTISRLTLAITRLICGPTLPRPPNPASAARSSLVAPVSCVAVALLLLVFPQDVRRGHTGWKFRAHSTASGFCSATRHRARRVNELACECADSPPARANQTLCDLPARDSARGNKRLNDPTGGSGRWHVHWSIPQVSVSGNCRRLLVQCLPYIEPRSRIV